MFAAGGGMMEVVAGSVFCEMTGAGRVVVFAAGGWSVRVVVEGAAL